MPPAPPGAALWQIELDQIRGIVLSYLRRQSELPLPASFVRHAELAFGMADAPGTDADSIASLRLQTPDGGTVLLRGKIDRVDVMAWPDGGERLFVVDYKTGELPKPQEDVQALPVYIAAARELTGLAAAGSRRFHGLRGTIAGAIPRPLLGAGPAKKRSENEAFAEQLDEGLSLVSQAALGIAGGSFDIFADDRCPQESCPYRRICGHSDMHRLFKEPAAGEPEVGDG